MTPPAPRTTGRHTISKTFTFEAGHRLASLGEGHKCSRQHGHSYTVELILTADTLVPPGFVTDFGDLEPFARYIKNTLDHRNLNEVEELDFEPTSENLAQHLAEWAEKNLQPHIPGRVKAVRVSETPKTWAQYDLESA
jgi:6-pyruvoyltetrahydropterin/6-carboxytetrahydropterin synthase